MRHREKRPAPTRTDRKRLQGYKLGEVGIMATDISVDEAKHAYVEEDEDGLLWVVRDEEYQEIYSNRIICEAFRKTEDETHEDMLIKGYFPFGKHEGRTVYVLS